jgi:hypothetical protein
VTYCPSMFHTLLRCRVQWHIGESNLRISELQIYDKYLQNSCSHNHRSSRTGIFRFSKANVRKLPTTTDNKTCETIHPSVRRRKEPNSDLLCQLLPLEEELRKSWPYPCIEGKHDKNQSDGAIHLLLDSAHSSLLHSLAKMTISVVADSGHDIVRTQVTTSTSRAVNGHPQSHPSRMVVIGTMCKEFLSTSG